MQIKQIESHLITISDIVDQEQISRSAVQYHVEEGHLTRLAPNILVKDKKFGKWIESLRATKRRGPIPKKD